MKTQQLISHFSYFLPYNMKLCFIKFHNLYWTVAYGVGDKKSCRLFMALSRGRCISSPLKNIRWFKLVWTFLQIQTRVEQKAYLGTKIGQ